MNKTKYSIAIALSEMPNKMSGYEEVVINYGEILRRTQYMRVKIVCLRRGLRRKESKYARQNPPGIYFLFLDK